MYINHRPPGATECAKCVILKDFTSWTWRFSSLQSVCIISRQVVFLGEGTINQMRSWGLVSLFKCLNFVFLGGKASKDLLYFIRLCFLKILVGLITTYFAWRTVIKGREQRALI